ncbi:hypothetical protein J2848_005122 [Azospirillum lipoferum]|uniref:Uncharacterized protein n=1 Tax=Azospirillum lipoferum TaxID=193 RepID=A0A5A9G4A4_AZOLI|nr:MULTISPECIES: hypothetical protein [Azospirillum]KAA0589127.1 hypothetical protein FZ942_32395 [Azospirillum lipoferum]MCP1613426.1 hypothetical protein [Azospirillum lipoferum]MDW5533138.1 hypothetical protein [Azospirillum sp. NL1]
MHSDATSRLVDAVVRTRHMLDAARRSTIEHFGEGPRDRGKSAVLMDIRDLHDRIIRPIIESRQPIVRDVGTVWFQEDIGLVHEMPRAIVHFTSVDSAEDAPHAYMTIHVGEDGTTSVSENFLTPVKTTDVRTCRLDDLDSEAVALMVDRFLAKAIQG